MTSDMISVIIPAYNAGETLEACVRSVMAQTCDQKYLELLIVDDGSTDETPAIAKRLSETFDNLRLFRQDNAGPGAARNLGIREAKGAWISFVDSDDEIAPQMIEVLHDLTKRHHVQIAQISRREVDADGHILPDVVVPPAEETVMETEPFLRTLLLHEGDASFCTKLTARSLFSKVYAFPEDRRNEDFHLMMRMCGKAEMIAISPERLYTVHHRPRSGSRFDASDPDYIPQGLIDALANADDAYAFCEARFPTLMTEASRFCLAQRLDYLLHVPVSQMRADNTVYKDAVRYLRAHRKDIRTNPLLTGKERRNLNVLSVAPRLSRTLHARLMARRRG